MSEITTLEAIRQASEASKKYTDTQIDDIKKQNNNKPYDVATKAIYLNHQQALLKLTINNLLDGDVWTFYPFDLICEGSDGRPQSSYCTIVCEADDNINLIPRGGNNFELYPSHYLRQEGNTFLYFLISSEYIQMFIRGLVNKCTGATLEIIEVLPDGAEPIYINKYVEEDYISYSANGYTSQRPIGHDTKPYSIVCRNSASGINVRTPSAGKTYADAEAVNYGYLRDTILAPYAKTDVYDRVSLLEGFLFNYVTDSEISSYKKVPALAKGTAILDSVGGHTVYTGSCLPVKATFIENTSHISSSMPDPTYDVNTGEISATWYSCESTYVYLTLPSGVWDVTVTVLDHYSDADDPESGYYNGHCAYHFYNTGRQIVEDGTTLDCVMYLGSDGPTGFIKVRVCATPVLDDRKIYPPYMFFDAPTATRIVDVTGSDTYIIPSEIRSLEGYGEGLSQNYNYLDFTNKQLVNSVVSMVIDANDIRQASDTDTASIFYFTGPNGHARLGEYRLNGFHSLVAPKYYENTPALGYCVPNYDTYRVGLPKGTTLEEAKEKLDGLQLVCTLTKPITTDVSAFLSDYTSFKTISVIPGEYLTVRDGVVPWTVHFMVLNGGASK